MIDPMLAFLSVPLLDLARIEALGRAMKPDALHRTIEAFRSAINDRATEIRSAMEGDQHTDAIRLTHSIKGVSGNFGAARLGAISGHMEAMLNRGDTAVVAALVDDLIDTAQQTAIALADVQEKLLEQFEQR